jgi:Spy/CpxP family protein refolding chaperone
MRLCKLALVLGAVALLAGPALAQPRGGGFGRGGFGGAFLLRVEKVQKDLGLEKDQVTKVEEALRKAREDNQDEFGKLRDASPEERTAIMKKINDANDKAIKSVLNEKQMARLKQIERQQAGIAAFQEEDVQKTLKLTDDQKGKIKEINDDLQKETRELFQGGFNPENMTKMQTLRKDALTSATKVLTDDQKKTLKEKITGEPLEIKPEDFPRGGFGGKPGGGKPDKPRTDF